jgi:glycerol-3-phosphate dehydrogenase
MSPGEHHEAQPPCRIPRFALKRKKENRNRTQASRPLADPEHQGARHWRQRKRRAPPDDGTFVSASSEAGLRAGVSSAADAASTCDVLVVGGGINGAGIARDLAGRGLRVVLCEKDDLAAHTSSASTKLIHGGLRYLEYYEFSLVRKALAERERLMKSAPHIMRPLRFVMPHDPSMRPVWMVRIGLFLYDHLARREWLPGSRTVNLRTHPAGQPLQPRFTKGFIYSDGWVDDARLVVLNAIDAAERGARILTRCRCTHARREGAGWRATLRHDDGREETVAARALVNAAGPWAAQFLREDVGLADTKGLRLVKGSHIVVRQRFQHDHAYIFQNPDKRIIFAIPYEGEFTLIGTTDVEDQGPIGQPRISADETAYLCEQASRYLAQPVTPADVVWSYSGVRPLLDDEESDASAVTRDYLLELQRVGDGDADPAKAPLLSVWGGKITTFRKLAEEAADLLCDAFGERRAAWTAGAQLPGGDLRPWIGDPKRPDDDLQCFTQALQNAHPQLPPPLLARWARDYGARIALLLGADTPPRLGASVAPGVYEAELRYLHDHEWARCAEDVLWRRTKLGLHLDEFGRAAVAAWWRQRYGDPGAPAAAGAPPMEKANAWN